MSFSTESATFCHFDRAKRVEKPQLPLHFRYTGEASLAAPLAELARTMSA